MKFIFVTETAPGVYADRHGTEYGVGETLTTPGDVPLHNWKGRIPGTDMGYTYHEDVFNALVTASQWMAPNMLLAEVEIDGETYARDDTVPRTRLARSITLTRIVMPWTKRASVEIAAMCLDALSPEEWGIIMLSNGRKVNRNPEKLLEAVHAWLRDPTDANAAEALRRGRRCRLPYPAINQRGAIVEGCNAAGRAIGETTVEGATGRITNLLMALFEAHPAWLEERKAGWRTNELFAETGRLVEGVEG